MQLTTELAPELGLPGAVRHGIRVQLDDAAASASGPLSRARLHLVDEGHVVEGTVAAGAEEEWAALCRRPIQPLTPHGEGRRDALLGDGCAPPGVAEPFRSADESLQGSAVGREHDAASSHGRAVAEQHPYAVRPVVEAGDLRAGADVHPEPCQVSAQRSPQRGVVVVGGHVKQKSLGRAGEVGVEHRHELTAGEVARVGEEAAGEDLERQVPGLVRETQPVEDVGCAHPVVGGIRLRELHVEQAEGCADVDVPQCADREARAPGDERSDAEGRRARDAREGVGGPVGEGQGVVGHRDEPLESRVGAAQQGTQVVVLPEEGMEAAAHRERTVALRCSGPGPHPTTERGLALDQHDWHTALGKPCGSGKSGDAAADDDDGRGVLLGNARRERRCVALGPWVEPGRPASPARERRKPEGGGASSHAATGRSPMTVCTTPRCQPSACSVVTLTRPARRSRSSSWAVESMSRVLRQR